jgi:hypothetical protein
MASPGGAALITLSRMRNGGAFTLRRPGSRTRVPAPATGGYLILLSNGRVLGFHAPTHDSLAGKLPPHTTATAITGI